MEGEKMKVRYNYNWVDVSPDTTPDDVRAVFPEVDAWITQKRGEHFNWCMQQAACDRNGSYKDWLERVLKEIQKGLNRARLLPAYLSINEYRKIVLSELARLEDNTKLQRKKEKQIDERLTQGDVKKILDALEDTGYCDEWRAGKKRRLCALAVQLIEGKTAGLWQPTSGKYEYEPFEAYLGIAAGLAKTAYKIDVEGASVRGFSEIVGIINKAVEK